MKHIRVSEGKRGSPSPRTPFPSPSGGHISQKTRNVKKDKDKKRKKENIKRFVRRKTFSHAHARSKKAALHRANKALEAGIQVVANSPIDARGLTGKDQLFVMNLLKGMPKAEAMRLASEAMGCTLTDRSAAELASQSLKKPQVDSAICKALEEAGIDDVLIAQKLKAGLDAYAYTQMGIEHEDYRTRLAYIQTILKVKGQISPDAQNTQQVLNYTSFKDEEGS